MTTHHPDSTARLCLVRSASPAVRKAPMVLELAGHDPVTERDIPRIILPRSPAHVEGVVGDELFEAVAYLGEALDLPNLIPGPAFVDVDDIHDADTAEFVIVLGFAA